MTDLDFIKNLEQSKPSSLERAIALIWYATTKNLSLNCAEIINIIEKAGFGKQNSTRLSSALKKDKRVIISAGGKFKISFKYVESLNTEYDKYLKNKVIKSNDKILDSGLFQNSKGYIKKVINQLNISYEYGLYDCCAVMCRRLLETLIIETYEHMKKESEIKDSNGQFLMFSGLLTCLTSQNHFTLGRNALRGLNEFKTLGDLSAHNRRFNARDTDIDKIQNGLRIACEELLNLSNQGPHK